MAVSKQLMDLLASLTVVRDTDSDATAENDVNTGAGIVHMLRVDNSANLNPSYLKIYDALAPTVGTTAPDFVIPVSGGVIVQMAIMQGGVNLTTGVSFATVTTAGTAGVTNPTNDVVATLIVE